MKVKKFMSSIILSIVAFVTSFTVAFSETPQSAQYTIAVPESVVLNKTTSDGSGTYAGTVSVTAKGSILSDQRVYFSASNPEMHRTGSAAVTGTTTATTATDWDSTNVTSGTAKTAYKVSANITPGSWTGTMMFFATVTEKYDILLGDNTTLLLAQNENAANVKFSSSAPGIATVDASGHIQTVSAGDTTITKMVYDSTGKSLLYTAVYNITVSRETAEMVTTRLAEPLKALTAAGTTIDSIQFGQYTIPSGVTTYDVSGNGSNTIKAFVDGTALKVTNTRPSPVKFAEGNSLSFDQNSAFANITTIKYDSVDTSKVTSAYNAFANLTELTSITGFEKWDTSKITDMGYMFYNCSSLESLNISSFNTANVTDMRTMFYYCSSLTTLDVRNFDTTKVTNMEFMFSECSSITTLDVSHFNTAKVTNMRDMFSYCSALTTLNLSHFDTASVTGMTYMFRGCSNLTTLDISNFDTSSVTSMNSMFFGCSSLTSLDLNNFNTANVTDMTDMFRGCSNLTSLDLNNFNTANVTTMTNMFFGCSSLTSLDVSNFDTAGVTSMETIFYNCSALTTLNLSHFDTAKIADMRYMFYNCSNLTTLDISNFDTSSVTNMASMFYGCSSLTSLDVSNFNTANVTNMSYMFYNCSALTTLDVSKFNTASVTNIGNIGGMLSYCNRLTSITVGSNFATANLPEAGWSKGLFYVDTKTNLEVKGEISNALKAYNFAGDNRIVTFVESTFATYRLAPIISSLSSAGTTIDSIYFGHYDIPSNTTTYDVSGVNDGSIVAFVSGTALKVTNTYNGPIKFIQDNGVCFYIASKPSAFKNITEVHYDYVDTSLVAYCDNAFYGMSKLTTITGLENWDTSNMTSMSYMFYYCPSITKLNVANFDTSKVTDMREMFESCNSLTSLDVSHFDTSKVTRMRYMFSGCQSLTSLDVSNFNTSNVIDMGYMFLDCHSLKELDLKAFDTKNVVSMYCMFGFSWSLENVDISSFDTSNVTDMSYMFEGCNSLKQIDVSNFNTCKVESMAGMFTDCYSLTSVDVSNFNTSMVTDFSRMFGHCFKLERVVVGNSVLTKNLPVTGTDKGLFWVENNTHLTIVGNASSALRAYNYSGDNRTVSYVSSLRANSLNTKIILSEQTQHATPETAQRYDERPAA